MGIEYPLTVVVQDAAPSCGSWVPLMHESPVRSIVSMNHTLACLDLLLMSGHYISVHYPPSKIRKPSFIFDSFFLSGIL